MTRQYVQRTNQSGQKETKDSGILQRTAVRELPAKTVTPQVQTESPAGDRSGIKLDLMQIPLSNHTAMPVQAKLEIRPAGDKYEQEADRLASQVVDRINASGSSLSPEDKLMPKQTIQGKSLEGGEAVTPELETSIEQARGSGMPIAESIRKPMEQSFGADFSGVRVHNNPKSNQLNQSMPARAFTTGKDIFFRQGEYNPGSLGGQELIAHELTHVVQQTGGTQPRHIGTKPNEAQRKPQQKIKGYANIQLVRDRSNNSGKSQEQYEEIEMVPMRPDGREEIRYERHPAFPIWSKLCQEAGMKEKEIHESFMDVMGGVRAGLEGKNPQIEQENRQEAQLAARELMEKFAQARTKELETPDGGLVLWSGCKDLASEYAQKNNGKALADTDLGKAIDAVEEKIGIWSEAKGYAIQYWDILGPFWEEVSRQLAKTSIGNVTVLVTSNRENTVFHRVEKFALKYDQKVSFYKAAPVSKGSKEFQIVSGPYESWEAIKPHLPAPNQI
ncbi:MAG: DUF4157 domain-containing protein [Hormoscilla sp. GM7CHS1pb]|nr:DUF4157 domain-containing protein [Hormoscilla sp. GM7CHS1pb]